MERISELGSLYVSCLAIRVRSDRLTSEISAKEGLRRMTRNHIHLAQGVPGADSVISGTLYFPFFESLILSISPTLPQVCAHLLKS